MWCGYERVKYNCNIVGVSSDEIHNKLKLLLHTRNSDEDAKLILACMCEYKGTRELK